MEPCLPISTAQFCKRFSPPTACTTPKSVLRSSSKEYAEYVQGMCDLLAPVLHVIQDEYLAFWAFVALMRRMVLLLLARIRL